MRIQSMSQSQESKSRVSAAATPEPWLRGTLTEVRAVPRGVLHALELAGEDLQRWCWKLTEEQLNARPAGLAPLAFHLRHIARSLDRLLTYAEGKALTHEQLLALKTELGSEAKPDEVFKELTSALYRSSQRVLAFADVDLEQPRTVGRRALPTTVGGLLVHIADHTQRHVGQAIITAKVVNARTV
jgi:uncharacterized damage-inducible protein DinB